MPGRPVASSAVRSAISTASSPLTPSFAGRGSASRRLHGDLGIRKIAERMHDFLLTPRFEDARVAVSERGDAEAAREVEKLAPVVERDAAALGLRPDHDEPRRRTRPAVAFAIVPAIAGFSCNRRNE